MMLTKDICYFQLKRRIFSAKEDLKSKKWISEEVIMGNESYCNNALQGSYARNILSFGEDESGMFFRRVAYLAIFISGTIVVFP